MECTANIQSADSSISKHFSPRYTVPLKVELLRETFLSSAGEYTYMQAGQDGIFFWPVMKTQTEGKQYSPPLPLSLFSFLYGFS
jgi:hypothetical protein